MDTLILMPSDFPAKELIEIGTQLRELDLFVADYPGATQELYSFENYLSALNHGQEITILPDRNVVSRMAQAAKGNVLTEHEKNAAAVLAFAQCLDIAIEPSIAFHEMAFNEGNVAAMEELSWFQVADQGRPEEWVAAALGKTKKIATTGKPLTPPDRDLALPLKRWRRNYVVSMKMAELELKRETTATQKVMQLLEWMKDDFIIAGPASVLALLYFAPNSPPRKGLLKGLRSPDRQVALAGAKNAAWDITYLSDFVRRINDAHKGQTRRHIFVTFDKRLRNIARIIIGEYENIDAFDSLTKSVQRWWPQKEAEKIIELLAACVDRTRSPDWWKQFDQQTDYVGELIERGEKFILDWKP